MSRVFYDHLIDWDKLTQSLDSLSVDGEDRIELIELIEESLHTEVLLVILHHLPQENHKEFIQRFHSAPHDESHLHFISSHTTTRIDDAIRAKSQEVFENLLIDFLKE